MGDEISNDTPLLTAAADQLAAQHFAIVPNFLDCDAVSALRDASNERLRTGSFQTAKVGQGERAVAAPFLRNDVISWINEDALAPAEASLLAKLEQLKLTLNRELFLGLHDLEAHYARFSKGHYYGRHIDRFRTDDARTVSLVLYLNADWKKSDQGQLRLYGEGRSHDVSPTAGTLVCFMSAEVEHEVIASPTRERLSIAAWLRR